MGAVECVARLIVEGIEERLTPDTEVWLGREGGGPAWMMYQDLAEKIVAALDGR